MTSFLAAAPSFALVLFSILRVSLPRGPYEMDHGTIMGTFHLMLTIYQRFFYWIAAVSLIGGAASWYEGNWPALLCLMFSAFYALLFNGLLIYFYERYTANRYPRDGSMGTSNYTLNRYALILALGLSAFALMCCGMVSLAMGAK